MLRLAWLGRASVVLSLAVAGCGASAVVRMQPEASTIAPQIGAVIALPARLSFGSDDDRRRGTRQVADALIACTGGRVILDEELAGAGSDVRARLMELGEDPRRTLTFSASAERNERVDVADPPIAGMRAPVHVLVEYRAHVDVRQAGRETVIGTVDAIATLPVNEPEITSDGRPRGLQRAITEAIEKAVAAFAPALSARREGDELPRLVEMPHEGVRPSSRLGVLAERLRSLQAVYPERSAEELLPLAASDATFLVITPGRLARFGIASGDLLGASAGGRTMNRAALARSLARGAAPALYVERKGERFLIAPSLLASGAAP